MKTMIAIVLATALLGGIVGAGMWTKDIAGFDIVATTIMSAILGASIGTLIGFVAWGIRKLIG